MAQRASDDKSPAEHAPPSLTVCVIAYNSGPTLAECLDGLAAQTFRDLETLIIDNASPDPGDAEIAAARPWMRLVRNTENLGFAGAGNQAARLARGRWLVLLNPDARPEPDWLAALTAAAARHPTLKAFTSKQLAADAPGMLDGLGDVMSITGIPYRGGYLNPDVGQAREGLVFSPCGAAMMIDRALFETLGGFDEDFFCYGEDVDLGYRLQLAGHPTLLVPDAVVHHHGSASTGGRKSEFAVFHGTRNRFWVLFKNTPGLLLPLVVPLHLLALMLIYARAENRPHIRLILRAVRAAFASAIKMLAKRSEIGRHRRASFWTIARAMTWNPRDLSGRRPVIRRLPPSAASGGPPSPAEEDQRMVLPQARSAGSGGVAAKQPEWGSDAPTPPPTRSGGA